ncbi:MAG: hypothetical protein GF353_23745 [Candidatus Lokiarchaeota archaeon]|nr:hypothetical protein [Candidatus Lokiarchaeota archaeon]
MELKMEKKPKEEATSNQSIQQAYDRAKLYNDLFAHDINNILNNIKSAATLSSENLKKRGNSSHNEKLINLIQDQVERGIKVIKNLQDLYKLEENEMKLKPINLCEPLNKSIEQIKNAFQEKPLYILIDSKKKRYRVLANELLQEVFNNILNNAVKYNDRSAIIVSIRIREVNLKTKKYIELEFQDNGIGISDIRKKQIFVKQLDQHSSNGGMGLGLFLVKRVIDEYNGYIHVEDRVKGDYSQGSNFVIKLPLT